MIISLFSAIFHLCHWIGEQRPMKQEENSNKENSIWSFPSFIFFIIYYFLLNIFAVSLKFLNTSCFWSNLELKRGVNSSACSLTPVMGQCFIHSSILAWRIPWTEKPSRLQATGSQRVGYNWATSPHLTSLNLITVRMKSNKLTF